MDVSKAITCILNVIREKVRTGDREIGVDVYLVPVNVDNIINR